HLCDDRTLARRQRQNRRGYGLAFFVRAARARAPHLGGPQILRPSERSRGSQRRARAVAAVPAGVCHSRRLTRAPSTPRPPSMPPAASSQIGLRRVASRTPHAATLMTTAGQLVSAARPITTPLAMISPTVTGARPARTLRCHRASRKRSHIRKVAK